MPSKGLSSDWEAKSFGATLMAAPVSIKIPKAAVFLVPMPKMLLLLLCSWDLAGKFVVEAFCSKLPMESSSPKLPKLLVVHLLCAKLVAKLVAGCCCFSSLLLEALSQQVLSG